MSKKGAPTERKEGRIESQDSIPSWSTSNSEKIINSNHRVLHFFYQNVRGINSKLQTVSFPDFPFNDILVITESWLNPEVSSCEIFDINIFNVFRKDRANRRGEG